MRIKKSASNVPAALVLFIAIAGLGLSGCKDLTAPQASTSKSTATTGLSNDEAWSVTQERLKARKLDRDAKNKQVCLETIGKKKCEEVGYVFP